MVSVSPRSSPEFVPAVSAEPAISAEPGQVDRVVPVPSPRAASPRVVIVDESAECREVLQTLLESRGVPTADTGGAHEALELLGRHHPEVVVLDLDAEAADDERLRRALDREASEHQTALIVLGKSRRAVDRLPDGQVVSKPYHYAPLIRTIERLLAR